MSADVLAIVQARSSSTRLPGKVLADLVGAPMIMRQLERIARATTIDRIVVATSIDASDDALAELLTAEGVTVRRGPLDDVFERFRRVVEEMEPRTIVRLTADCPLTDPAVIDAVVAAHHARGGDYTSNVIERTYPHGLDAECVSASAFETLARTPLNPQEREHVTLGLYTRPESFHLESVTQAENLSKLRWTVDYSSDLDFARAIYSALYPANPAFSQRDIVDHIRENPELEYTSPTI